MLPATFLMLFLATVSTHGRENALLYHGESVFVDGARNTAPAINTLILASCVMNRQEFSARVAPALLVKLRCFPLGLEAKYGDAAALLDTGLSAVENRREVIFDYRFDGSVFSAGICDSGNGRISHIGYRLDSALFQWSYDYDSHSFGGSFHAFYSNAIDIGGALTGETGSHRMIFLVSVPGGARLTTVLEGLFFYRKPAGISLSPALFPAGACFTASFHAETPFFLSSHLNAGLKLSATSGGQNRADLGLTVLSANNFLFMNSGLSGSAVELSAGISNILGWSARYCLTRLEVAGGWLVRPPQGYGLYSVQGTGNLAAYGHDAGIEYETCPFGLFSLSAGMGASLWLADQASLVTGGSFFLVGGSYATNTFAGWKGLALYRAGLIVTRQFGRVTLRYGFTQYLPQVLYASSAGGGSGGSSTNTSGTIQVQAADKFYGGGVHTLCADIVF